MLRLAFACWALSCASICLAAPLPAQAAAPPPRVFLDCADFGCDFDFFRREIGFVDHVRDPADAGVHILVTRQSTGGGGEAYAAVFIERDELGARRDTLRYFATQDATDDQTRKGLARIFKLGLIPYVAGTAAAERISIDYSPLEETDAGAAVPTRDPWNYWVFELEGSAYLEGESRHDELNLEGGISANRTTETLKLSFELDGGFEEENFEIDSTETITSSSKSYGADALFAYNIGGQWAAGAQLSASRSTYENRKLGVRFAPGIEYDFFPYSESARRLLTVRYQVGVSRLTYDEPTIFDVTEETLVDQSLRISLDAVQPWGTTGVGLIAAHYLDDFSKNSVELFGDLEVRVFRGFSLEIDGSISRVRNQRYLPRGGLSPEEVLLRQRALATDYRFYASLGFSYSFGSIFNNVVNPRFEGGGFF